MMLTLCACTGGASSETKQAAKEISELTGQDVSAEDIVSLYELGSEMAEEMGIDPGAMAVDPSADSDATYAAAYAFYSPVINAMTNTVDSAVSANNDKLEQDNPDGYFSDPAYMILFCLPFLSVDMAFTDNFADTLSPDTVAATFKFIEISLLLALMLCLSLTPVATLAATSDNLLVNPGFEGGMTGWVCPTASGVVSKRKAVMSRRKGSVLPGPPGLPVKTPISIRMFPFPAIKPVIPSFLT